MHNCRKYIVLIFLFAQLCAKAGMQDTLSFDGVEKSSYRLYQHSSWDCLARYCDYAIGKGYDYYYLRMRAGIACFKLNRYRKAIPHFEKALMFSVNDAAANEYLYYCYLYSGQYEQARWLAKSFDSAFCKTIGAGSLPPVSLFAAEGGPRISSNKDLFKTAACGQVMLSHYAAKRASLFHAVTYYQQDESRYAIKQYQYYLRAALPLHRQWLLSAGAQLLFNRNTLYDSVTVYDPPPQGGTGPGGPGGPPPDSLHRHRELQTTIKTSAGYVVALTATKSTRFFDAGGGLSILLTDSLKQYQLNGTLVYYPFASPLLGIGGSAYIHTSDRFRQEHVSFAPALSLNLKRWSATAVYTRNLHTNAIEYTGYLVSNSEDLSPRKYTLILSCRLNRKTALYGVYNYETKEMAGTGLEYNYNAYIIGIRITPY